MRQPIWAYGVTTIGSRRQSTLPETLRSLAYAGFGDPFLFVDGGNVQDFGSLYCSTIRSTSSGGYPSWMLAAVELLLRLPHADRYAIFEDDIRICFNARKYLDRLTLPENAVWNLFSEPRQERHFPDGHQGFLKATEDHFRGALALVFHRSTLLRLLVEQETWEATGRSSFNLRKRDSLLHVLTKRFHAVEYVHAPSLVQHAGEVSTLRKDVDFNSTLSRTFPGEKFDALNLLRSNP